MTDNNSVLVVEDNPQDEMLILRTLSSVNLMNEVQVVRDGQQALDYIFCCGQFAEREPELPALILLDAELPCISGIDVLQKIRADPRTASQPVALMTSSQEEHDRLKAFQNGVNMVVRKPLDFAKFSRTVASLGVYWMAAANWGCGG